MILLIFFAVGALAGFASGFLGVGGGTIVVPALLWIFLKFAWPEDIVMHMATGTSLAIMAVTTSVSLWAHLKREIEVWDIFRWMWPWVMVGTILGSLLAVFLATQSLVFLFGLFLFLIALSMLCGFQPLAKTMPNKTNLGLFSGFLGFQSGLLGIGGAVLTVPYLIYCNIPIRKALAISIACGITVACVGTISFMWSGSYVPHLPPASLGYIYLPAFFGIALVSPLFAWLGAWASHRVSVETLRRIFAVFLMLIAIRMLWLAIF
jgi:uncharacterized membrane protein YfcA